MDLSPQHVKSSSSVRGDKISLPRRNHDGSSEQAALKKSRKETEILWDCLPSTLMNLGKVYILAYFIEINIKQCDILLLWKVYKPLNYDLGGSKAKK